MEHVQAVCVCIESNLKSCVAVVFYVCFLVCLSGCCCFFMFLFIVIVFSCCRLPVADVATLYRTVGPCTHLSTVMTGEPQRILHMMYCVWASGIIVPHKSTQTIL